MIELSFRKIHLDINCWLSFEIWSLQNILVSISSVEWVIVKIDICKELSFIYIAYYHLMISIKSEWLLLNTKWKKIQLYHGENKLHFNEMMMMSDFVLDQHTWLVFILPAHWNNSPGETCCSTRTHYPVIQHGFAFTPEFWLVSGEATNSNFIVIGLTQPGA